MYDVIIAGAGPAGASAAYFLGKAGRRVLVLEKQTLPRYKACGGGLSLSFLKQHFPFSFDPVIESTVEGFNYHFGKRKTTILCDTGIMALVMRDRFDQYILEHANCEVRQGCAVKSVLETNHHVTIETTDGEVLSARYLIGADGSNSITARSLGLNRNRRLMSAIEAEVNAPEEIFNLYAHKPTFIFPRNAYGYLWIFPKMEHLSVGIIQATPKPGELRQNLAEVMQTYGINLDGARLHGHPIPLYTPGAVIAGQNTLLVGDAASLVDPFSGEGIRPAIKSGRLAAEAILSGHISRYPAMVEDQIGKNHRKSLWVARVFYPLCKICLWGGARNPITTYEILELLSDHGSTANVFWGALGSLPYYVGVKILMQFIEIVAGKERQEQFWNKAYPGSFRKLQR
jgi:geranylgeranyl reductase family protein